MKKILILTVMLFGWVTFSSAQKIAIVDMSYLLKNIPMYESANEQLKQISQKWQKEVDALNEEAELLYKNYQTESVFLSDEMKRKKENEIVAKEKQASDLKRTYFGPDGEYYKKRESLMKPIQDEVYVAVKDIADTKGYQVVLDKSSSQNLIYFSVKVDISKKKKKKLGYSK